VSSLVLIGRWLDYLKTQDVYDNTKIIIVSDHGASLRQYEDFVFEDSGIGDAESFYPLLLVKDFNDRGKLKTSDEFMTNADVPTMAFKDTVENPVNPFTGKAIDNSEKYAHNQYIIASVDYIVSKNNGNAFLPARWYSVHDSIWDRSNWQKVAEDAVLKKSDVEKIEKGK
jgi:arylsulfatase A-like enzyme